MTDDRIKTEDGILILPDSKPKKQGKTRKTQNALKVELLTVSSVPFSGDISYTHPVLAQCTLPMRRKVGRKEWNVKHGNVSLNIQAGKVAINQEGDLVDCDVPYGSAARVAMLHINNHIVRAGSLDEAVNVDLGHSFRNYCAQYNLPVSGQNAKQIQSQMVNIAQARLTIGLFGETRAKTINVPTIASEVDFWLEADERQGTLWNPTLTVNPQYAMMIRERSVPQDMRAVIALYENTGAMDLFIWLSYRLPMAIPVKGVFIPFDGDNGLHGIFGKGIADKYKFRQKLKEWLLLALKYYPDANVRWEDKGIRLFHSPAPVLPDSPQQKSLFFDGK